MCAPVSAFQGRAFECECGEGLGRASAHSFPKRFLHGPNRVLCWDARWHPLCDMPLHHADDHDTRIFVQALGQWSHACMHASVISWSMRHSLKVMSRCWRKQSTSPQGDALVLETLLQAALQGSCATSAMLSIYSWDRTK